MICGGSKQGSGQARLVVSSDPRNFQLKIMTDSSAWSLRVPVSLCSRDMHRLRPYYILNTRTPIMSVGRDRFLRSRDLNIMPSSSHADTWKWLMEGCQQNTADGHDSDL